jgi:hypothetical protein
MRVSGQSSFIRSIRIRYLSGLLIFAITCGVIFFAMNRLNSFRHEVDLIGTELVELTRDMRKATAFAEQATANWRTETRDQLASAALGHTERLNAAMKLLNDHLASFRRDYGRAGFGWGQ